jgi:hypothetical protein
LKTTIGDGKWIDAVLKTNNTSVESSGAHMEISKVLKEMGYRVTNEFITPNGFSADICVYLANGDCLLLEVDGPFHFLSDDMSPTGATLFKRRLLTGEGFKVVSVNLKMSWRWLKTRTEQKEFLTELIDSAVKKTSS